MSTKAWDWSRVTGEERSWWEIPAGAVVEFAWRLAREGKRTVYDLGCGLGRHLVLLAEMGFDVRGCDLSAEAVAEAERRLEERGLRGRVRVGNMIKIEEPDQAFDAVLAYNVIYHALPTEMEVAIREVHRILRPNGLFLSTFQAKTAPSFRRGRRVAPATIVKEEGAEEGIPHTYLDRDEVLRVLSRLKIEEFLYVEHEGGGLTHKGCHYLALARRRV